MYIHYDIPLRKIMYTLWILFVVVLFHQLTAQTGKWYAWKQNEYFYGDDRVDWDFAKVLCERDLKAKLVVIETKEESSFLRNLYPDEHWMDTDGWIGLRQGSLRCGCEDLEPNITCRQCRESWRWYDGTPMAYMEWHDGEPDSNMCGRLTDGGWAEYLCSFRLRYLCERHLCVNFTCIHGDCKASNGTSNCQCHPGYTGVHCDSEINECLEEPCLNNGICEDRVNDYWCNCTDSCQGKNCENDCSGQKAINEHSCNALYAAIVILGAITTLLLGLAAVLCILGRRKIALLQKRLKELTPSHEHGVETNTQSKAAMETKQSRSKPDTPYEDISNIDTNDHDAMFSTANVQGTLPIKSQQRTSTEDDVLKGKNYVNKKLTKHAESRSQEVSASDVRLYEPLDVYANAEEQGPQSTSAEYAQLNHTTQFR